MTKKLISEKDLPVELKLSDATSQAYTKELASIYDSLSKKLSTLVEVDKEVAPWIYRNIRERFKNTDVKCVYVDGRPTSECADGANSSNPILLMIGQIRDIVRNNNDDKVMVLPHIDLLTTSAGGLNSEAKEVISLMYENPNVVWLAFKDPSFSLPSVISNMFPHQESIVGLSRDRLQYLITQREARKFGKDFDPVKLYKYVSGMNVVKLRTLLASMHQDIDYPEYPENAYKKLRACTLTGQVSIPNVDMWKDIGGYHDIKSKLNDEIVSLLKTRDNASESEAKDIEAIMPRGMIFHGPPGTGKTFFAKAIATALNAACFIVSGPELKSKYVGESESNLRNIFTQARKSAPAVIVFDEIDSFAHARGTYTGSGVEHSMVNQLLTEMDGFRKEEMVFVIGTTNFVESLDPALLRPGRFEFHIKIENPDEKDRKEIIQIYNTKMNLQMSEEVVDYATRRTENPVPESGVPYSGDHLNAFARQLSRTRLRTGNKGPTTNELVDAALMGNTKKPIFTDFEEKTIATHEAGHAVVALNCSTVPPIEKISISSDLPGALGFVQHADRAHKYVMTKQQMLDMICVFMGGREAEGLCMKDMSLGSGSDIVRATEIARSLVEDYGMGEYEGMALSKMGKNDISESTRTAIDRSVRGILDAQRLRAKKILEENQSILESLRDLLLEKKVLDANSLKECLGKPKPKKVKKVEPRFFDAE